MFLIIDVWVYAFSGIVLQKLLYAIILNASLLYKRLAYTVLKQIMEKYKEELKRR